MDRADGEALTPQRKDGSRMGKRPCASGLLAGFQGGTAAGSIVWGAVAARLGIPTTLLLAAVGLIAGLTVATRYRLARGEKVDLTRRRCTGPSLTFRLSLNSTTDPCSW